MASNEHKKLSSFIKATHNELRKDSRIYGPEVAWNRHLARTQVLKNYAASMQELATAHWKDENLESESGAHCRNKWIRSQCYEYFFNGGKSKFEKREFDIRNRMIDLKILADDNEQSAIIMTNSANRRIDDDGRRIKVLDVGSCYNPLGVEKMFDVTPIDLAPFSDAVSQCDFLNVKVGSETVFSENGRTVKLLKVESFDVVVFSLLLEYFPCPKQRYACCRKAYDLLKSSGILVIITPDSNHVGANARIMKSWRLVLSRMGFMRIVYEKSRHLHCLAFRKCAEPAVAARWANMQIVPENDSPLSSKNEIYIPQDFRRTVVDPEKSCDNVSYDADELVSLFGELPPFEDSGDTPE